MDTFVAFLASLEQLRESEKMLLWTCLRSLDRWAELVSADLAQLLGRPVTDIPLGREAWDRSAALEARCRTWGIEVLARWDHAWPPGLNNLDRGPFALWIRGGALDWPGPWISVVGTRRPSEWGRQRAHDLGAGLARHGIGVVSGLAYGVDGAAHAGVLSQGGRGLAILAGGVDGAAPLGHRPLAADLVTRGGALVSQYPPGSPPQNWRFVARNRLIAAWAPALVVVEAPERSGALITVDFALEEGRDVWVPADLPRTLRSRGTWILLDEGARALYDVEELVEEYGRAP